MGRTLHGSALHHPRTHINDLGTTVAAVVTAHQLTPAAPMGQAFELPDGTKFNRAPKDMRSWEIQVSYRLAWHLATFLPSTSLAQALANWLCSAQRELERRGEWQPEVLPPQSM